jgi:hypothetical protein
VNLRESMIEIGMCDQTFDELLDNCSAQTQNALTVMLQHFHHVWETDLIQLAQTGISMPKDYAQEGLGVFREYANQQEDVTLNDLMAPRVRILSLRLAAELAKKQNQIAEGQIMDKLAAREEEEREAVNDVLKLKTELGEERAINDKLNKKLTAMDRAMRKYAPTRGG